MNIEMIKMVDISEILGKAFEISTKQKFSVMFFDSNNYKVEAKEMSYMELGIYLTQNTNKIEYVKIYLKSE